MTPQAVATDGAVLGDEYDDDASANVVRLADAVAKVCEPVLAKRRQAIIDDIAAM